MDMIKFYEDLLSKYGHDVRSLGWGSLYTQHMRFEQLLGIIPHCGKSMESYFKILDVGCGFGDLFGYLMKVKSLYNFCYFGVDMIKEMIEIANSRYESDNIFPPHGFIYTDFNGKIQDPCCFDYVVASGIFSHSSKEYLLDTVSQMYRNCSYGVAFNCLKAGYEGERLSGGESYFDPKDIAEALQGCDHSVEIIEDYLPNDFTIYLIKQ